MKWGKKISLFPWSAKIIFQAVHRQKSIYRFLHAHCRRRQRFTRGSRPARSLGNAAFANIHRQINQLPRLFLILQQGGILMPFHTNPP